jgi:hypothetical protein
MESGSHAGPHNGASNGEFPSERSVDFFGSTITDKVELHLFSAFKKLFEVDWGLF